MDARRPDLTNGSIRASRGSRMRHSEPCTQHTNNMKLAILALCLTAVLADVSHILPKNAPGSNDAQAQILKLNQDIDVDGSYKWELETDNGIAAHQHGELKKIDAENVAQVAQGAAQWTAPNGEVVQLSYIADENGYQPQGSHIPTSPPIPEAILRALEYIRAHPPKPEDNQ